MYCAITGYGQDGPDRDRPGHDMNYLARGGLLGLSGARGGPPVPAAGQIADLGGGALMAAFGILAALHERERSGEGQLVDVSMTRGAQSWLAMVAARFFADGAVPRRGELELAGGLACYRPYACADGWVTLGALEPKFWQALCGGLGREDLLERHMDPAVARRARGGLRRAHARRVGGVRRRARMLPGAGARPRRGARPRARRPSSRSTSPAPPRRCGCSARRSRSRARRPTARGPARRSGADTDAVLAALGYDADDDRAAARRPGRSPAPRACRRGASWHEPTGRA